VRAGQSPGASLTVSTHPYRHQIGAKRHKGRAVAASLAQPHIQATRAPDPATAAGRCLGRVNQAMTITIRIQLKPSEKIIISW